jgi:hypothetical protein
MKTERLLRKASHVLGLTAGAGMLAMAMAPATARAQYSVSDSQLGENVTSALHKDAKLNGASVSASAVAGVITLSGNVSGEDAREEAEQVVAGVSGVRSIQDNINVAGASGSATAAPAAAPASSAAPTSASGQQTPEPVGSTPLPPPAESRPSPAQQGASASGMPPAPPPDQGADQQTNPLPAQAGNQPYTSYPNGNAGAPTAQNGYPNQNSNQTYGSQNYPNGAQGYPPENNGYGPRGNAHPPQAASAFAVTPRQQNSSGPVTLPLGTLLSVRTTEPLSTSNLRGGEYFQATAATDVYANGVVAIPRGAVLTGLVVEAKNAGPLAGSPKLDLRLTTIQLGPALYPLASEVWSSQGRSKSGYTATNAVGGAAVGALIGAIAGSGVGAGVGAIAGGATGAVVSGATHGPRLDLPPEALLQFQLAQSLTVQPVPYEEAMRLASSVPQQPVLRQRPMYVAAPYPAPYPYMVRPYPYAYYSHYYYPRY